MNKQTIITILLAIVAMAGQDREKFMNLQLINIIGSHLSR